MAIRAVSHLIKLFEPGTFAEVIDKAVKEIRPRAKEFDAIAFTGLSGSLVVPPIAYLLNKPMIVVRKDRSVEPRHSYNDVEGVDCERYLIVDDGISSGATITTLIKAIRDPGGILGKPVGLYLWGWQWPGTEYPYDASKPSIPIWS